MNSNCYGLLVSVGNYEKLNAPNLPAYRNDLFLMKDGLCSGLRFDSENICMLGEEGTVSAKELARMLSSFEKLLKPEDVFVFYFSGHGKERSLLFSDVGIELQSILIFIEKMPARSKIVILDCCYSGDFETDGAHALGVEETIDSFAGKGISIFASSSADAKSYLSANGKQSVYTELLSSAMKSRLIIRRGKVQLSELAEEISIYLDVWSKGHSNRKQRAIYRASMGGTVFFDVKEYHPYRPKELQEETVRYYLSSVKPISNLQEKRLTAFAIPKGETDDEDLAEITKEIAEKIRYEEIHPGKVSEQLFRGKSADVIWCYFGRDESDLINSLYFAVTTWGVNEEQRRKYFREKPRDSIIDGISVSRNKSYDLLRELQETKMPQEEYILKTKEALSTIVTLAEQFIVSLQEVMNGTMKIGSVLKEYGRWVDQVNRTHYDLDRMDVPPDDIHEWAEEVYHLAGCIQDIAMILHENRTEEKLEERYIWLIKNAVRRYYDTLQRIRQLEENI